MSRGVADRSLRWTTALADVLAFVVTLVIAGHAVASGMCALHPTVSISNRVMVAIYCLWFLVAAQGPSTTRASGA